MGAVMNNHGKKTDQKMKPYLVYEYLMRYSDINRVVSAKELKAYLYRTFRKLLEHIIYGDIKTRYNVFRKYANDGLILPTSYASALRLILGALHLVVFHTTLVEQSSSARLQASLQTRSALIIWRRQ